MPGNPCCFSSDAIAANAVRLAKDAAAAGQLSAAGVANMAQLVAFARERREAEADAQPEASNIETAGSLLNCWVGAVLEGLHALGAAAE